MFGYRLGGSREERSDSEDESEAESEEEEEEAQKSNATTVKRRSSQHSRGGAGRALGHKSAMYEEDSESGSD